MSRIHLTIDELVLRGLDPAGRQAFVAGLTRELQTVLANRESRVAWARPHRTPVLRLNRMSFGPGSAGAGKLAAQVAKGIGSGLKP